MRHSTISSYLNAIFIEKAVANFVFFRYFRYDKDWHEKIELENSEMVADIFFYKIRWRARKW